MRAKAFSTLFLLCSSMFAQSTTVFINDSNGNQTTGTISNGNVYFHDSKGNSASGTIRNGSVFLSTDRGEITFGTIKGGNVFLTDQNSGRSRQRVIRIRPGEACKLQECVR